MGDPRQEHQDKWLDSLSADELRKWIRKKSCLCDMAGICNGCARADAEYRSNTMLAALKDAVSRFAKIASGCTHGPCNPDNPCDHCIALGWLETHGSLKIFESERE